VLSLYLTIIFFPGADLSVPRTVEILVLISFQLLVVVTLIHKTGVASSDVDRNNVGPYRMMVVTIPLALVRLYISGSNVTRTTSWAPRVNSHSARRTTLLSPLGLTVAKSSPLATRRKVDNHSPRNKTHLPEINQPQARISGVEISIH
jgi:hypothetical protein